MNDMTFKERLAAKLRASGETGRGDLQLHDMRSVEAGTAVRVLATYSSLYGAPSVWDVQSWLQKRLGAFADKVVARPETIKAYPEQDFVTFIIEQKRLRQPLSATENMVSAGPSQYLDNENGLWEVVKGEKGAAHIVRRETTSVEEMLNARQEALKGKTSFRKNVTLAAMDSLPAGGGFASLDLGDIVDFYFNGQIHRGKAVSVGSTGVKITHLTSGDSYTVDPAAITAIIEKSAGSAKQQDDVMRRYYSLVFPGNPEMTEIISPSSNKPIVDDRNGPGGEPLQPIEVAASARVSGFVQAAKKTKPLPAPYGMLHDYKSGEMIRPATKKEEKESKEAAEDDGGAGVIKVDGQSVFVSGSVKAIQAAKKTKPLPAPYGMLHDYKSGEMIRPATKKEEKESNEAAKDDGGAGVIKVDGQSVFVSGSVKAAKKTKPLPAPYGMLHDYKSGEMIRPATKKEEKASNEAAEDDGGAGVIKVDGQSVFVSGSTRPFVKTSQ